MKQLMVALTAMMAALTLAMVGCGGSSGGGVAGVPNPGPDPTTPTLNFDRATISPLEVATFSAGVAINDANTIVGLSDDADGHVHPVVWQLDSVTATATAPSKLELLVSGNFGAAHAINESGMVVGESEDASQNLQAVLWLQGTASAATTLPALDAASRFSAAYGININGLIVGESEDAALVTMPVMWSTDAAGTIGGPTMLTLPAGAVSGSAYFVTDSGKIVGEYSDGTQSLAIMWTDDGTGNMVPTDLGALLAGLTNSVAYGVNEEGLVVGEAMAADGAIHGILWDARVSPAIPNDLGEQIAESNTLAINNLGCMAGWIAPAINGNSLAATWESVSITISNFSTLFTDATLSQGYGINNSNNIVGLADNQVFAAIRR